nr:unnamed protein product [Callosobruchus chinensis]
MKSKILDSRERCMHFYFTPVIVFHQLTCPVQKSTAVNFTRSLDKVYYTYRQLFSSALSFNEKGVSCKFPHKGPDGDIKSVLSKSLHCFDVINFQSSNTVLFSVPVHTPICVDSYRSSQTQYRISEE